jgi:hypothetical protein
MNLPPEILCMVKSSLTNHTLYFVELTCRYLFWSSISNKEWQLRKCKLWNKPIEQIIFDFIKCQHVCCWKYRTKYLSLKDIKFRKNIAIRWIARCCNFAHGHLPVVQYLCEKFQLTIQDVRSRDNEALRYAAFYGNLPVVKYLCEYRDRDNRQLTIQDVRSEDNEALRYAALNGHLPVVVYLCEYPDRENRQLTIQDVRSRDNEALRYGASSVVQYLRQKYKIDE